MSPDIIHDPEAMKPSYLPEKLLFREKEYSQLLANLRKSLNTVVYGPSGSGKTLLMRKASLEMNPSKIKAIYIDCSLYKTTNAVLREILIDRPIASRSNYDLLKRLMERARNNRFAVCLDHIKNLEEKEVTDHLIQAGVCVAIACNSYEQFQTLDPRTRTAISGSIDLKPYTVEEAFRILEDRAEKALDSNAYSDETIGKIVEKTNGGMAVALNVLMAAAVKAESQKKSVAEIELEEILLEHNCPEGLNADEKTLIQILREWKSLPASRLHDFYIQKSKHPRSERAFRNYMENLCSKGLIKALGEKRGRTYEIVEGEPSG